MQGAAAHFLPPNEFPRYYLVSSRCEEYTLGLHKVGNIQKYKFSNRKGKVEVTYFKL